MTPLAATARIQGHVIHQSSLVRISRTVLIDQNAAYHLSADCEEVASILLFDVFPVDQTDIRFVDQCAGLKGVAYHFTSHVSARNASQFGRDTRC
jgi:hypothetical protein